MSESVAEQVRQAREALNDATGARSAGLSETVIINRCYYACFHAAQAVLYDRGFEPTSHGGVLSLFGSEVVTAGDISREHGRFLNDCSTLRKRADYGPISPETDVDDLIEETESFVDEVLDLVEK